MFSTIEYTTADRVATITLNQPDHLNAINNDMPSELRQAVEMANADDEVHVIVLTGEGSGSAPGMTSRSTPSERTLPTPPGSHQRRRSEGDGAPSSTRFPKEN